MADYRKMYYRMVDASERALELLEQRREDFREQFLWQQLTDLLRHLSHIEERSAAWFLADNHILCDRHIWY